MTSTDIGALNSRFGSTDAVRFESSPLGGPVARLRSGASQAVVALQGAQVLRWAVDGREALWLSPVSKLGAKKAVRGGIPVCWPWFGPHPSDPAKPAHGFVRTRIWDVVDSRGVDGRASITLAYRVTDEDRSVWPHRASARLTVTLDAHLSLALETTNLGDRPFDLTEALHTYFRVGDIAGVRVEGLDGAEYIDKVDGDARKRQTGIVTIDREVDRIYLGKTTPMVLVEEMSPGRAISIESQGSGSAVVWNPWRDKTIRLGDMGDDEAYREMICVETTNAAEDVVRLEPGGRHVLSVRYAVQ